MGSLLAESNLVRLVQVFNGLKVGRVLRDERALPQEREDVLRQPFVLVEPVDLFKKLSPRNVPQGILDFALDVCNQAHSPSVRVLLANGVIGTPGLRVNKTKSMDSKPDNMVSTYSSATTAFSGASEAMANCSSCANSVVS